MIWRELNTLTGGLSNPGKMPGPGWSIPAIHCRVGSKLRLTPGSVCYTCYALKGNYTRYPAVYEAMERRLAAYNANPVAWSAGMVESIQKKGTDCFRWFDSGDLQSVAMLGHIASVAAATPSVAHWLPTRERETVKEYILDRGTIPENLTVRLSAAMVDAPYSVATRGALAGIPRSVVRSQPLARPMEFQCPAPTQGNQCGDCRACWNPRVGCVSYGAH